MTVEKKLSLEEQLKINAGKKIVVTNGVAPQKKVTNEILEISKKELVDQNTVTEEVAQVTKDEVKEVVKTKKETKVDDRAKLLLRIPEEMKENLSILADRDGRTVTGLITILLKKYINEDENKEAIFEAKEVKMKY